MKVLIILASLFSFSIYAVGPQAGQAGPSGPACVNQDGCTGVGQPYGGCISTGLGCYALNPNGGGGGGGTLPMDPILADPQLELANDVGADAVACPVGKELFNGQCIYPNQIVPGKIAKYNGKCVVLQKAITLSKSDCLSILGDRTNHRTSAGAAVGLLANLPTAIKNSDGNFIVQTTGVILPSGPISDTYQAEQPAADM